MWSRIRPRCAISLGKSIAVAFSNSRSPREYEFATDTREKAESRVEQSGLTLPVAYDLSIAQMVQLGLYISDPASEKETDRPFAEPGVFAVNEEGLLQLVDVSNAPFLRPELDAVLGGIGYVRKPQAERADSYGKSYPIRGTHIPSQGSQ